MITWKKIDFNDSLGLLACAALIARSAQVDGVNPKTIEGAVNSLKRYMAFGADIAVGFVNDQPVLLASWWNIAVAIHVAPEGRKEELQRAALGYAVEQTKPLMPTSLVFFAENMDHYQYAIDFGFSSTAENDDELLENPLILHFVYDDWPSEIGLNDAPWTVFVPGTGKADS